MQYLLAILWKNGIIRIFRHKTLLIFLLLLPVLLFFFIAYARSKLNGFGKDYINGTTYSEQIPANYFYQSFGGNNKLVYAPKTKYTDRLIREVQLHFQIPNSDVEGLESEDDLLQFYKKYKDDDDRILGVIFLNSENLPKSLNYQLRTYEKDVDYQTSKLFHTQIQYMNGIGSEQYKDKGLLALQLVLDFAYINMVQDYKNIPDRPFRISFQEFPYPPYLNDHGFNELFAHVLPLATLFSFILICPDLLKRLVEEKVTGIKELMKMMGMSTVLQWTGWFVSSVLMCLVSITIIVVLMKAPIWHDKYAPIEYCSWSIYATFLILYCIASISKCFLLSTFFQKPSIVIVFGIFFWILSYIIPVSITNDETTPFFSKILLMLLPNMCLYYGYKAIAVYELREIGMQWSTITSATDGGDNDVEMIHVFGMLVFNVAFYFIFGLYFDTVNPGPYGIRKPFTFPLTYIMDMMKWKRKSIGVNDNSVHSYEEEVEVILEKTYADNSQVGIRVENLRKVYDNNVIAVNCLNVKFLKGEITALLGHNGAGKTTTLSILSGIINRTSGRVFINGNDISDNISLARRSMGICTQHNLFFQDLTVMEHLKFFGMVKGQDSRAAKTSAEQLLQDLHMYEKRDALPMLLSGGMKRKLCLGIALCGNPEVLILDEPTSGMDVQTRRFIWDKLLERRRNNPNCTTIVSTHFMEEAEVIGDRIAIMNRGELSCYGTLTFLKNTFDTGYRLKLTYTKPEVLAYVQNRDEVDSLIVSRSNKELRSSLAILLDNFNSVIEVIESNNKFLECKMPTKTEDRQKFLQFLKYLEDDKEQLNIGTINITNVNLEDIYLKHLNTEKLPDKYKDNADGKVGNIKERKNSYSSSATEMESGACLPDKIEPQNYSVVMWTKRWHVFRNTLPTTLMQCVPSILLITVLMFLMVKSYNNEVVTFKSFNYRLNPYGKTSVYYGGYGSEFDKIASYYEDIVKLEGSIPIQSNSVSNAIIQAGSDNIAYYRRHMVAAAEFNLTGTVPGSPRAAVNIMYSNSALHGAPIALNLITNTLLKWIAGPDYSIQTANCPLPGQKATSADMVADAQQLVLFILVFPIAIFTFLCIFLSTPWQDISSRMKHLQHMSGLSEGRYWLSLWAFDIFVCTVAFAVIVFFFMGTLFGITGLVDWLGSAAAMGILFMVLMTYAIAALPLAYIMSHLSSLAAGVNVFLISGLFSGFVPTVIIYVMEVSNDDPYVEAAGYLSVILSFWPQFGLCYASLKYMLKTLWIYNWDIKSEAARKITCHYEYNPCCDDANSFECGRYKSYLVGNDISLRNTLFFMFSSTIIYFLILTYLKRFVDCLKSGFYSCTSKAKSNKSSKSVNENELESRNIQFKVNDVAKEFNNKTAVNGLSFEVKKQSLFGILGVNGAGKSTTFKVLAGIEKPTRGTAEIFKKRSFKLQSGVEYTKQMGYCPQEDFLVESLTGRQILNLFAGLRGIRKDNVDTVIKRIGIEEHADKCCGSYSGGTKRKLCLGIAVLGNLPILLLDEPTTGVDPKSKRDIWTLLRNIQRYNECSIVLTSHSMDECEALSDRLLIMKEGVSHAENTVPLLKEEYGHMYKVVFKAKPDVNQVETKDSIEKVFNIKFKDYDLFDHHGNTYNYHIQKLNVLLSTIFEVMENLLLEGLLNEYIVHEPTLEDVFLEVAKPTTAASEIKLESV